MEKRGTAASLWIEKYRPRDFETILGLPKGFSKFIENPNEMPHFLFIGSAGCGKTTTAKVIIKELNAEALIMNSSLDRSIEIIRKRVTAFAQTKSINGEIKIIFLDEADGLRSEVQDSLKNLMETFAGNVRFILTANKEAKIIEPLKSRCKIVRFGDIDDAQCLARLKKILEIEGVKYEESALTYLVGKYKPDVRTMVNEISDSITQNRELTLASLKKNMDKVDKVIELINKKDFDSINALVLEDEAFEILNDVYAKMMESKKRSADVKSKINKVALQSNFYGAGALNKKMALHSFVLGLIENNLG